MAERKTLTNVEMEFMHLVWEHEPVVTDDIQRHLAKNGRDYTDGGIRRILSILMKKGFITRTKEGRAFSYESTVGREEAEGSMLDHLRDRLFKGSASSMVAALLKSDISAEELGMVKQLIDDAEEGGGK